MVNSQVMQQAAEFISQFEGFRSHPYPDSGGVTTIGYGTTVYPNGIRVSMDDAEITKEQALTYLQVHLYSVQKDISRLVNVSLSNNQAVALMDFIYNLGVGNFQRSNLLRRINLDDGSLSEIDFVSWNKADGKVLDGLTRRREKEWELYLA